MNPFTLNPYKYCSALLYFWPLLSSPLFLTINIGQGSPTTGSEAAQVENLYNQFKSLLLNRQCINTFRLRFQFVALTLEIKINIKKQSFLNATLNFAITGCFLNPQSSTVLTERITADVAKLWLRGYHMPLMLQCVVWLYELLHLEKKKKDLMDYRFPLKSIF